MKRFSILTGIVISLMISPLAAIGANERFPLPSSHYIKHLGTSEGLSQPCVTAVLTDASGAVWIGTRYRLNKYVNGRISTYDESKIDGSYIHLIFEDSDGQIWIGTESALMLYDAKTDCFFRKYSAQMNCAVEYEGNIYFAGVSNLVVFDKSRESFSIIPTDSAQLVLESFVLKSGTVQFVDKFAGLLTYSVSTGNLEALPVPELDESYILSATVSDGLLYIGTFFKGLYVLDAEGNVVSHYSPQDYPDLNLEVICDVSEVDSRIFIATDGGGLCTIENGRIVNASLTDALRDVTGLPKSITKVEQDRYSNIWVGSVKDGLFGIRHTYISKASYMGDKQVFSLCQDGRSIWIGTDEGVVCYDVPTRTFNSVGSIGSGIVSSLALFGKDRILAYVYCRGLYLINKKDGTVIPFTLIDRETAAGELYSGYNLDLYNISGDDILLAGEKVYRYNVRDDRFTTFASDSKAAQDQLHTFYVDEERSCAYAYSHSSVFQMDLSGKTIRGMIFPEDCGRINTAAYDRGKIYIGTDTGLLRYDEQTLEQDSPSDIFKRVTCLSRRENGILWVVADHILYSFDTGLNTVEMYDEAEGFSPREVVCSDRLGNYFYFGGDYNLFAVPRDVHRNVNAEPSLSLLTITIDGRTVSVAEGSQIKLGPRTENVSVLFNLTGGDPFRATRVRYSLDGQVQNVTETRRNYFTLPALEPGRYTVSASVLLSDGRWSTPVKYLEIKALDILWRRKWFIGLLGLLVVAVVFAIITRISRNADREISKTQKEEMEKRARFIKSIDAELRKPLSSISNSLRSIISEDPGVTENTKGRLEKIYTSSAHIEKVISDAVEQVIQEEDDPFVRKLNGIIDQHISENELGVALLVKEMGMSRTVLYDRLKSSTGMGVNEYLQRRRLLLARKYLVDTEMSVAEISDALGFSSPKYFSEVFKNAYEVSPREFKRRIL